MILQFQIFSFSSGTIGKTLRCFLKGGWQDELLRDPA